LVLCKKSISSSLLFVYFIVKNTNQATLPEKKKKKQKTKLREHTNKFRSFSLLLDWRDKKRETLNDNVVFVPRDPRFQKNILEKSELY
jgi:hypothetical protein